MQEAQQRSQGVIPAANISYTARSVAFNQPDQATAASPNGYSATARRPTDTATPAQMEAIATALSSQAGLSEATAMRVAIRPHQRP